MTIVNKIEAFIKAFIPRCPRMPTCLSLISRVRTARSQTYHNCSTIPLVLHHRDLRSPIHCYALGPLTNPSSLISLLVYAPRCLLLPHFAVLLGHCCALLVMITPTCEPPRDDSVARSSKRPPLFLLPLRCLPSQLNENCRSAF